MQKNNLPIYKTKL